MSPPSQNQEEDLRSVFHEDDQNFSIRKKRKKEKKTVKIQKPTEKLEEQYSNDLSYSQFIRDQHIPGQPKDPSQSSVGAEILNFRRGFCPQFLNKRRTSLGSDLSDF